MRVHSTTRLPGRPNAFTLVELLVVIAIIVALLAMLMPSMAAAIRRAEETVCATDVRTLCQSTLAYAADYHGALPDLSRRPTDNALTSNVYWSWPQWRKIMEDVYGVQRQNWFSVSNPYWQADYLYYWGWNGSNPNTATHMVMGRFYFGSSMANGNTFYNSMISPPPADQRPLFPERVSDRSYFSHVWTDLNREYPDVPGVIDWSLAGEERIGANHLYGDPSEMPAGTHIGYLDGSIKWSDAGEMAKRTVYGSAAIWW